MTETVDAALDEIIKREAGRKLVEMLGHARSAWSSTIRR